MKDGTHTSHKVKPDVCPGHVAMMEEVNLEGFLSESPLSSLLILLFHNYTDTVIRAKWWSSFYVMKSDICDIKHCNIRIHLGVSEPVAVKRAVVASTEAGIKVKPL